jgi:hypothetical protein
MTEHNGQGGQVEELLANPDLAGALEEVLGGSSRTVISQSVTVGPPPPIPMQVNPPQPMVPVDISAVIAAKEHGRRNQAFNDLFERCMNASAYKLIPAGTEE